MKLNINFKKLEIDGNNKFGDIKGATINIFGDWAPASGKTSDLMIQKGKTFYEDIFPYINQSDINIVNLETVIDNENRNMNLGGVRIIDKKEVLSSLHSININLACLANNHIMDNGEMGLKQTIKNLKEYAIDYVGAGIVENDIYKPYSLKINGQNISVINAAEGECANEKYNNHIGAADLESYKVADCIRKCKKNNDFVIVILHAGIEFIPVPPPYIRDLYRTFVELGSDLIVGHHPHVVQGIEIYNDVPIVYSLGHFGLYRDYGRDKEKEGLMINLTVVEGEIGKLRLIPFKIKKTKIETLNDNQLEQFNKNFIMISKLIRDNNELESIWNLYAKLQYPIIKVERIVNRYLYDAFTAKVMLMRLTASNSLKFLFLTNSKNIPMNLSYIDLLREYEAIRNLKIHEYIFVNLKNIFKFIWQLLRCLDASIRYINKTMFK